MIRTLLFSCLLLGFVAHDAFAHGGSFRGPNGGIPPNIREPSDPEPPPPPPTDPGGPSDTTTPGGRGPVTPEDDGHTTPDGTQPPGPTQPTTGGAQPKGPKSGSSLTLDSWRFWWGYNNDRILNLKSHIHSKNVSSASPLHYTSRQDENNRVNVRRPTMRAIDSKIIPALMRSLNRPKDHEDIHGGALVALGKIGTPDAIAIFEKSANNRWTTKNGTRLKFGYQAVESAVLGLGLLPELSEQKLAETRRVLLDILDNDEMRSRERAWAAVSLGLQRDKQALQPLWERLTYEYTGKDKVNVPAGILCGIGLMGDDSIRPELESRPSSARISSSSAIVTRSVASSSCSSVRPSRVRRPSGVSKMWLACTSEKPNGSAMSPLRASGRSAEARIRLMTSSSESTARSNPSTRCARSPARARRNSERRRTTSI